MLEYCSECGLKLILDDGYLSCPVYMENKEINADEHTSYWIDD